MSTISAGETRTKQHSGQAVPEQRTSGGLGLYILLFVAQTVGAAIVFIKGVPIYRQIVRDVANHRPRPGILWWAVTAVVFIQIAYWARVYLQPPLPRTEHIVIGHLAYFIARLSFIFSSSAFAAMFFVRFDQLYLSPQRIIMVLVLLFSMFCWTLELERLAKALNGTEGKP